MFIKTRPIPSAGSIPALLGMFEREVRFYREIAPVVGVRVPRCTEALTTADGSRLVLEDLSGWSVGGDGAVIARTLAALHERWRGVAEMRWPWLDREGKAAAEIGALYDRAWPAVSARAEVSERLRDIGSRFLGRVEALEGVEASFGRRTLIHGDATAQNVRTSPEGEVALLDWEDVRLASGEIDLTWLLISSVDPDDWHEVMGAYGAIHGDDLRAALPYAITQAVLCLADRAPGSRVAAGWMRRIEAAGRLLDPD